MQVDITVTLGDMELTLRDMAVTVRDMEVIRDMVVTLRHGGDT